MLICGSDHHVQAAALEALVYAVENGSLPRAIVEDALARQRRAKERFLAAHVAARPATPKSLRAALDRLEHRLIADEMGRYV
jgi:hypothetical protein